MLENKEQVALNNYAVVDSNPMSKPETVSKFEQDIIIKFLKSLTVADFCGSVGEDVFPEEAMKMPLIKGQDVEIEGVSSNFFYESFKARVTSGDKELTFIVKVSLDPSNQKLAREREALKSVSGLFAPTVIGYRLEEEAEIEFLCTSWEHGQSFEQYGTTDLEFNFGTFTSVIDGIHTSDTSSIISFKENLEEKMSVVDLFDEIEPKEVAIFEKLTDLSPESVTNILSQLKQTIESDYSEDIKVLSHSSVKPSNILYRSEYIKLINFENSQSCDLYLSLSKIIANLSIYNSHTAVKKFLTKYHENSVLVKDVELSKFLQTYEEKRHLNKIVIFYELLCEILFHFMVYGPFSKQERLTNYMHLYLHLKPFVEAELPNNIASFDKLFFTVMPTVKTYDMEELKIIAEMSK